MRLCCIISHCGSPLTTGEPSSSSEEYKSFLVATTNARPVAFICEANASVISAAILVFMCTCFLN